MLKRWLGRRRSAIEMAVIRLTQWVPIHKVRVAVIRFLGAQIAHSAVIYHGYQIRAPRKLVIGSNTSIGDGAILDARGGLVIGSNVNFSTDVHIWTAQHDWRSPDFAYEQERVVIEDRVWLGPRTTLLPGTIVREGAVVAAGAVVKGEVAAFTLVGGVPARRIADRPHELDYTLTTPERKTWWW